MILDRLLHVTARVLLHTCAPVTAHGVLARIGRVLPALRTRAEAIEAAVVLRGRGTCLSRALTVAARSPGAEVVVSVQSLTGSILRAHAWVELGGEPLDPAERSGAEIVRLRAPRPEYPAAPVHPR